MVYREIFRIFPVWLWIWISSYHNYLLTMCNGAVQCSCSEVEGICFVEIAIIKLHLARYKHVPGSKVKWFSYHSRHTRTHSHTHTHTHIMHSCYLAVKGTHWAVVIGLHFRCTKLSAPPRVVSTQKIQISPDWEHSYDLTVQHDTAWQDKMFRWTWFYSLNFRVRGPDEGGSSAGLGS